jgi:pimeloyl-ACP methyl ester carboxylesterase
MKRLIVLSDLWGKSKSDWFVQYETILKSEFEVVFYDCCTLGEIDLSDFSEDKIHQQFTNGGIERAVKTLLENEKENIDVLGFSVGGLIAWKAALEGLKVRSLFALSSTRLRYEEKQPKCAINLFYAEKDKYKPSEEWFRKLNLEMNIYKEQEHSFYCNKEIASEVSKKIIEITKPNR